MNDLVEALRKIDQLEKDMMDCAQRLKVAEAKARTVDSEREANSLLTEENEDLRLKVEELEILLKAFRYQP